MEFVGTFWSLVPPLVAIVLALITKETYSSLFIGIVVGALLVAGFNPIDTMNNIISNTVPGVDGEETSVGFINAVSSSGNAGIFIFLLMLGIVVALVNKAGGSAASSISLDSKASRVCTYVLGTASTARPASSPAIVRCRWPATIRRTCR